MKTTHGGWPVDEQAERQNVAAKATHNAFYGKENKEKTSKKKKIAGRMKHEVKEKHDKDYNDRNRSWDVKNRFHGGGVGGNTIPN